MPIARSRRPQRCDPEQASIATTQPGGNCAHHAVNPSRCSCWPRSADPSHPPREPGSPASPSRTPTRVVPRHADLPAFPLQIDFDNQSYGTRCRCWIAGKSSRTRSRSGCLWPEAVGWSTAAAIELVRRSRHPLRESKLLDVGCRPAVPMSAPFAAPVSSRRPTLSLPPLESPAQVHQPSQPALRRPSSQCWNTASSRKGSKERAACSEVKPGTRARNCSSASRASSNLPS